MLYFIYWLFKYFTNQVIMNIKYTYSTILVLLFLFIAYGSGEEKNMEEKNTENKNEVESPALEDKNIEKYVEIKLVKFIHRPKELKNQDKMELMIEAKNLTDRNLESFKIKIQALDVSGNYLGTPMWFTSSIMPNSRVTMTDTQYGEPFEDLSLVSNLLLMQFSIWTQDDKWWDTQAGNWVLNQSNPYNITFEL